MESKGGYNMQLEDFYDYKNQLMEDILTTESIVKLLADDLNIAEALDLRYTQIFPFEYIPEVEQQGRTFICFDVDVQKSVNKTYLLPTLYVWVFAHKSQLRLPNGGGVRTDKLCSEICKKINGSRFYGLGELEFYSAKRFSPVSEFNGKVLTFYMKEFNRRHDPKKPVPANRKGK